MLQGACYNSGTRILRLRGRIKRKRCRVVIRCSRNIDPKFITVTHQKALPEGCTRPPVVFTRTDV